MVAYPWPGNVRELTHVVERAALLHPDRALGPEVLGLAPADISPMAETQDGVSVDFCAARSTWRLWSGASSSRRSGTPDGIARGRPSCSA